jgi:beta-lactamase superfamily II metal-dependent hydrolase
MRLAVVFLLSVASLVVTLVSQPSKALQIYAVDVEGGKATLIVSPSRESLLIDTGNIGDVAGRDADRILAAAHDAGLEHIDHLVTTHWHRDHMGAMALLAARMPILEFIDHGANTQPDALIDAFLRETYPDLYARSTRTVVKPGDRIVMADLDVQVVASAGDVVKTALPGAGAPNPYCPAVAPQGAGLTENTQAIGLRIAFGRFRIVDLADLPADREFDLMCPNNSIGTADLFMVSHHGQPAANSAALVHAIESRVAILNNGIRKGGQPEVMKVIYSAPGLEGLWQLHASELSGQEYTAPGLFIANHTEPAMRVAPMPSLHHGEAAPPPPLHDGSAGWIKASAQQDGSFTVTNSRNGFSKTYRARGR